MKNIAARARWPHSHCGQHTIPAPPVHIFLWKQFNERLWWIRAFSLSLRWQSYVPNPLIVDEINWQTWKKKKEKEKKLFRCRLMLIVSECYFNRKGLQVNLKSLIKKSSCLLFCFCKTDKTNEVANGMGWSLLVKLGTSRKLDRIASRQ